VYTLTQRLRRVDPASDHIAHDSIAHSFLASAWHE
jgi:hypothetical protein